MDSNWCTQIEFPMCPATECELFKLKIDSHSIYFSCLDQGNRMRTFQLKKDSHSISFSFQSKKVWLK